MPKVQVSKFTPTKENVLLLDTNILIHLFYPTMSQSYMKPYEKLYSDALSQKATLILPAIQISEFVNRCIRLQYDLYLQNENIDKNACDFKRDYRDTEDYQTSMDAILEIIDNDIFPNFTLVSDQFDSINKDKILLRGFSYDFNDALLVQIAEKYNAAIITNDADFGNYSTKQTIISTNSKLLMFS